MRLALFIVVVVVVGERRGEGRRRDGMREAELFRMRVQNNSRTSVDVTNAVDDLLSTFGFRFNSSPSLGRVPAELADEGLIPVPSRQPHVPSRRKRGATAIKEKLWPNATIPFVIGNVTADVRRYIYAAMMHWEEQTCIRFIGRTTHRDFAVFNSGNCGCCSFVGRKGGPQEVTLSAYCATYGVVVHEIGHVVGFWHEHSRPDRDDHVNILRTNIAMEKLENFHKKPQTEINSLGEPYDYESVMHYNPKTFSKNGFDTMLPKKEGIQTGQRRGLSAGDIIQTRLLYQCPKPVCNFEMNASEQSFTSPSYPGNYFKDYECNWVIRGNQDEIITLEFLDFSVEKSTNCTFDYVELREGSGSRKGGRLVGRLCGEGVTGMFHTTGKNLYVKFVSDSSMTNRGFWGYYRKSSLSDMVEDSSSSGMIDDWELDLTDVYTPPEKLTVYVANCNHAYSSQHGTIASPLIPVDYVGQAIECSWTIDGGRNASRVVIRIETAPPDIYQQYCLGDVYQMLSVSSSSLSQYNRPMTYAGAYQRHIRRHRWYHHHQQQLQQLRQRLLRRVVRTRRDASYTYDDGYKYVPVRYDCLSSTTLFFATHQVVIHWFSNMHQPIAFSYDIDYDECQLDTHECDHQCENTLTGYRCLCDLGYVLQPDGKKCVVKERQISGSCSNGRTVNMTKERGVIDVTLTSVINSKWNTHPGHGQTVVDCQWLIRPTDDDEEDGGDDDDDDGDAAADADSGLTLQFDMLYIPTSAGSDLANHRVKSSCPENYLEVRVGRNLTSRGKRYCGSKIPPSVYLPPGGGAVLVKLKLVLGRAWTTRVTRAPRLEAHYYTHKDSNPSRCLHKIRIPMSGTRTIVSPGYPKPYPSDVSCTWRLSARRRDERLRLMFLEMDIEQTEFCAFDFLEVRNGRKPGAELIGRFCGNEAPSTEITGDYQLWMTFVSDGSGEGKGFRVVVTSEASNDTSSELTLEASSGRPGTLDENEAATTASPTQPPSLSPSTTMTTTTTTQTTPTATTTSLPTTTPSTTPPPSTTHDVMTTRKLHAKNKKLTPITVNEVKQTKINSQRPPEIV